MTGTLQFALAQALSASGNSITEIHYANFTDESSTLHRLGKGEPQHGFPARSHVFAQPGVKVHGWFWNSLSAKSSGGWADGNFFLPSLEKMVPLLGQLTQLCCIHSDFPYSPCTLR